MEKTLYNVSVLPEMYDTLDEAKKDLEAWASVRDFPYTQNGTIQVCHTSGRFVNVDYSIHFAINDESEVCYFD